MTLRVPMPFILGAVTLALLAAACSASSPNRNPDTGRVRAGPPSASIEQIEDALRDVAQPSVTPQEGELPSAFRKEVVLEDVEFPSAIAVAPDGRIFFNELRTGRVRVIEDGRLQREPFYDFTVARQPEAGLLGLALDPEFEENHWVYVFYTVPDPPDREGGPENYNTVVRLTDVDGRGQDPTVIVDELPAGQIHNAGNIHFGPDGMLYVSLGETDRPELAQDLSSPAGSILRYNKDGTIPDDNPFVGEDGVHPAIYTYGHRNPFDFAFHPVTGLLYISENGPGDNDELNLGLPGHNYGWPPAGYQDDREFTNPIQAFNPVIAPAGIAFYAGNGVPEWENSLLFCSYLLGELRRVTLEPPEYVRIVDEEIVADDCRVGLTVTEDGAVYYTNEDSIIRLVPERPRDDGA